MKILVVDDEQEFVEILFEALSGKGEAAGITVGSNMVHCVRHNRIITVPLDVALTDSDGILLVRELKKVCPDVYFILLSGTIFERAANQAKAFGRDGWIPQPLDLRDLQGAIGGFRRVSQSATPNAYEWLESIFNRYGERPDGVGPLLRRHADAGEWEDFFSTLNRPARLEALWNLRHILNPRQAIIIRDEFIPRATTRFC